MIGDCRSVCAPCVDVLMVSGVLGCGRVAPITQVEPQRPSSSTPSSPGGHHLTRRRRHTRVTPLPHLPAQSDGGGTSSTTQANPATTQVSSFLLVKIMSLDCQ